jgi:RNA polymerase sigma-70 factor (ECF subfamily)
MKIWEFEQVSDIWLDLGEAVEHYILKKVKNKEEAQNLSLEVLNKMYNSCCSGIEIKNVRSWVFQIAHNTVVDYFQGQSRFSYDVPEKIEDNDTAVYSNAEKFIKPLINLLPEKYLKPLQMADLEGLKHQEIADKLGLSLTATKSRVLRGRKLLGDLFDECCHIDRDLHGSLISIEAKTSCRCLKELHNSPKILES